MDKIKAFLEFGYFPVQLPPAFSSASFAKQHKKFSPLWSGKKQPRCPVEKFSVARSSFNRRVTSIVNPVAYYFLVEQVATYWGQIQRHYSKSSVSLSRPKLKPSFRAIEITRFTELYEARIVRSAGFKYALLTDISRFFPTIYTHSIPWALHGKEQSKKNRAKNSKYYGNILDHGSMGLQDWQTMGLPIGPDTSHVIAEIVATAVDRELRQRLGFTPVGFRYVDDYCFFFNSRNEAEKVLAELSKVLTRFELQINPNKTRIIEVKELVQESWTYSVRKLSVAQAIERQRDDIHKYFESLFTLEERFRDESLIKYGLKKIATTIVKRRNWTVYEAYLLKCGYAFPNALQVITTIFATYNRYGYPLAKKAIAMFCNNIIKSHAMSDGHSEIAWGLWLAKEMKVKVDSDAVRAIEASSSSVCKLICLDLANAGLTKSKVLKNSVAPYAKQEALYGDSWLLAYEAGRRKWLFNKSVDFIRSDKFFSELLSRGVSFYDQTAKCNALFEIKQDRRDEVNWDELFDSDRDVDEFFDFAETEEEYFDFDEESAGRDTDPDDDGEDDEPGFLDEF